MELDCGSWILILITLSPTEFGALLAQFTQLCDHVHLSLSFASRDAESLLAWVSPPGRVLPHIGGPKVQCGRFRFGVIKDLQVPECRLYSTLSGCFILILSKKGHLARLHST